MDLIPIAEAARMLPRKSNGKTNSLATIVRWITRGVKGVKLEGRRVGASWYTSTGWIEEFINQLSKGGQAKSENDAARLLPKNRELGKVKKNLRDEFGFD